MDCDQTDFVVVRLDSVERGTEHWFLIDIEDRPWCFDDCEGTDGPHYAGVLPWLVGESTP